MRVVLLLLVVALLVAALLPLLRRPAAAARRTPPPLDDQLVKDPVCHTYVVRSRAVRATATDDAPYFCSLDCARRYAG